MRGDAECRFAGYALKQATGVGTPAVRSIAAAYMSQGAWSPSPDQFVFIGNGRTSIADALPAVCISSLVDAAAALALADLRRR